MCKVSTLKNSHYRYQDEQGFKADIQFQRSQAGLLVEIRTEDLYMRSVRADEGDFDRYASLWGRSVVMEKFAAGVPVPRERIVNRIQSLWAERWKKHDPYSALAVFKRDTGEFVGHAVLGHGDRPGTSEIAGLGNLEFWGKGYGKQGFVALVKGYAPATVKEGYKLDGEPLQKIYATVRRDNVASERILSKAMSLDSEEECDRTVRNCYSLPVIVDGKIMRVSWIARTTNKISRCFFKILSRVAKLFCLLRLSQKLKPT